MILKIKNAIKNPRKILLYILNFKMFHILSDKCFLKIKYRLITGMRLDFKKPNTYSEKLQWLKIYDRNPDYSLMVDKYLVRDYITNVIGEEYLIPLLGVYDSYKDINFSQLPNQFVLKPNHTSGDIFICKDKSKIDYKQLQFIVNRWLKRKYFWQHREWPYKNVKPKIVCEKFLEEDIIDYKFYCFNASPKFLYVAQGDNSKGTLKMNFYDLNWKKCPFYREDHEALNYEPNKPKNFDEMVKISKKLSKDKPFVRIDLYNVKDMIYFGEITFFPGAGFAPYSPIEYENIIGDWIDITNV